MKKSTLSILAISFTLFLCTSCKTTKGCGLTSDASKIEHVSNELIVIAEVE